MIRSMTGYGEAVGESDRYRVAVSFKAVNHRYLDVVVRLGEGQRHAEAALREQIASQLTRGRVEVQCVLTSLSAVRPKLEIDLEALAQLRARLDELRAAGLIEGRLEARDVLASQALTRWSTEESWEDADEELLLGVASQALAQLTESRHAEGERLRVMLEERVSGLEFVAGQMRERRAEAVLAMRNALASRIGVLLDGAPIEADRLAQEVAYLAERSDIAEEIDRLDAHLAHARELLGGEEAVGKRLDFLAQEIFREINTVGSKCRATTLTSLVLDGKTLCDQFREQVQNVE